MLGIIHCDCCHPVPFFKLRVNLLGSLMLSPDAILSSSTCVGLWYKYIIQRFPQLSSALLGSFSLLYSLLAEQAHFLAHLPLSASVASLLLYSAGNINLLSIRYAFRPLLRVPNLGGRNLPHLRLRRQGTTVSQHLFPAFFYSSTTVLA